MRISDWSSDVCSSDLLRELTEEPGSTFQPVPALYQDFVLRCRMRRLGLPPLDLAGFRRRLAMARAGILDLCEEWEPTLAIGAELPEDILAPFLDRKSTRLNSSH